MEARRPDLDTLRGLAVALVVLEHAGVPGVDGAGGVGVTAFFVLSGWLITSGLLREAATGGVDLPRFWGRRVRRLVPALVVVVVVVTALGLALGDPGIASPATALAALLFLGDWPAALGVPMGALGHTWSLAVEEQFYLLWPPLLAVLLARAGRRVAALAAGGLAAVSLGWCLVLALAGGATPHLYAGPDVRAWSLLAGCLLALDVHERPVAMPVEAGRRWVRRCLVVGLAACGALVFPDPDHRAIAVLTPVVVTLTAAAWIAVGPQGRHRVAEYLGRRSYGLYLWHYPILWVLHERIAPPGTPAAATMAVVIAGVLLSVAVAEASWRWIEAPVLDGRGRGRSRNARTPGRWPGVRTGAG